MSVSTVYAQLAVTDLTAAEPWFTRLVGHGPDRRPMPGLLAWNLCEGGGLQVFEAPDRAGQTAAIIAVDNIERQRKNIRTAGITAGDVTQGTSARFSIVTDPDNNTIVFEQPNPS